MIAIRKDFIKTACDRVACADLGKSEGPALTHNTTKYPRPEKYPGVTCPHGHIARRGKYPQPDDQTDHNHRQIKAVKFGRNTHYVP